MERTQRVIKTLPKNKKDTIIILSYVPLTKATASYLKIPKYFQAGYHVIYLDLSEYYFPRTHSNYVSAAKDYIVDADYIVKCKNKKEILEWIKNEPHKAWFYIEHRNFNFMPNDIWLLRILKIYKCDYIVALNTTAFDPSYTLARNCSSTVEYITKYILLAFTRNRLKHVFQRLISYCVHNGIFLQNPRYFFAAGKGIKKKASLLFIKTEIVDIPSYNYEHSMEVISRLKNNSEKSSYPDHYIAYLDQSVFSSPDAGLYGKKTIDRNIFFKKINSFFDRIEAVTGKPVVIAASPKQRYTGSEYNGRKIVCNETATATYYSDMVVAHSTRAIDYAIIMKKPILLLTFSEFPDITRVSMKEWAEVLRKRPVDSEEDLDRKKIEDISTVNSKLYKDYLQGYLASGECSNISSSDIIIKKLKNDGQ
jgi:hypothetical protein